MPGMIADRLVGQEVGGLRAADDREAARLLEIRGDLGEELVVGEPDRDGDPELVLDPCGRTARGSGPGCLVQPLRAGQVEERLVDRHRLDQRRQLQHQSRGRSRPAIRYFSIRWA